jgi:DNA-binding transcriptional LysR family regulator
MNDPNLTDLDALVSVARARSFRGAAKLRGVSASSLSDAIRRLEERVGVRLLNRTTRSVTPTEAGTRLLERLTPALGEITGALDALNSFRDSPTGTLKLNVPTIVAHCILPPIVNRFLAAHPGIRLEVTTNDTFIDVLAAGFDAGIRYDESIEQDMIAVPIGPRTQRFICVATPAYLEKHGEPQHPKDLLQHACIRHRFASGAIASWEFERNGELVKVNPTGPLIASTTRCGAGGAGDHQYIRGVFDGRPRKRRFPARPRRMVAEFFRPLPLLCEPQAHAGSAARIRGFHQIRRREALNEGCLFVLFLVIIGLDHIPDEGVQTLFDAFPGSAGFFHLALDLDELRLVFGREVFCGVFK